MRHCLWLSVLAVACGPKTPPVPAAPEVGWVQHEGWPASCYFPPNFDDFGGGGRRIARSEALGAVIAQWRGEKDGVVHFSDDFVTAAETTLLGYPDKIEWVAAENAAKCVQAMDRGGSMREWSSWFDAMIPRMQEGLCPYSPLDYTVVDYLSITTGWQFDRKVCAGDVFDITASTIDYYRIVDGGSWINSEGDPEDSALGSDLPCNMEGCLRGQVILRYVGDDRHEVVIPVGRGVEFTAPGHGQIWVQINDDSFSDNSFKVEGGMRHHTSIEYDGEN